MDTENQEEGYQEEGFWGRVKKGVKDSVNALKKHPLVVAGLGFCATAKMAGIGAAASAASLIDVGNISDTLTEIGSSLFVGILNMVVGAWPVLILLGIIVFCNRFLGKILGMFDIIR